MGLRDLKLSVFVSWYELSGNMVLLAGRFF